MNNLSLLPPVLALLVCAASGRTQGLPVTRASRAVGLQVHEIVQTQTTRADGQAFFRIFGEAGQPYVFFATNQAGSLADYALTIPNLAGALGMPPSLALNLIDLNNNGVFGDSVVTPRQGVLGTIPAGGFQDLDPLPNLALPLGFNVALRYQVVSTVTTVNGPVFTFSNPVSRVSVPPLNAPVPICYTNGQGLAPSALDIENGDVDNDGDVDVVMIRNVANPQSDIVVQLTVNGNQRFLPNGNNTWFQAAQGAPPLGAAPQSAELADLDDDGWLDLVVAYDVAAGAGQILEVFQNLGQSGTGTWQGFAHRPNAVQFDNGAGSTCLGATGADIETGRLFGANVDLVIACGGGLGPNPREYNRVFANFVGSGLDFTNGMLVEVSTQAFAVPINCGTPGNPPASPLADNSEDCEIADFNGDGQLDLIFANFDCPGGPGCGFDNIWINTSTPTTFSFRLTTAAEFPGVDDPSLDVLVADFDGNGAPDIFMSNWRPLTNNPACLYGAPAADALYLNFTPPGSALCTFVNASGQLPDQALGAVPGVDAEAIDIDVDGDLDILQIFGTGGIPSVIGGCSPQNGLLGLRTLTNGPGGVFGANLIVDTAVGPGVDWSDIEIGDDSPTITNAPACFGNVSAAYTNFGLNFLLAPYPNQGVAARSVGRLLR